MAKLIIEYPDEILVNRSGRQDEQDLQDTKSIPTERIPLTQYQSSVPMGLSSVFFPEHRQ